MVDDDPRGVDVSVIIPTWQGRHLLETCLSALAQSQVEAAVVVVDNGSTDGSVEWLQAAYPAVRLIRNPRNLGFAVAVNQGIRATRTRWIALLNNDAVPEPDWLARLLEVGETYPRTGAVASRMMFRDNPRIVSSAGIRVDPSGGAWDLFIGKTHWPADPIEIFGASGGACLYRREMLDDIGLLDEAFFAYLEDVDLAWRAQLRKWKTRLSPAAVVYHALSATGGEGSSFKRYYLARNKWRVIVKNYPNRLLARNILAIGTYDALSVLRSVANADGAALRGRADALRALPGLVRQRRGILNNRLATDIDIQRAMSPIESPIALHRRSRLVSRLARGRHE